MQRKQVLGKQLTVKDNYTIYMKYRSLTNVGIKTTRNACINCNGLNVQSQSDLQVELQVNTQKN